MPEQREHLLSGVDLGVSLDGHMESAGLLGSRCIVTLLRLSGVDRQTFPAQTEWRHWAAKVSEGTLQALLNCEKKVSHLDAPSHTPDAARQARGRKSISIIHSLIHSTNTQISILQGILLVARETEMHKSCFLSIFLPRSARGYSYLSKAELNPPCTPRAAEERAPLSGTEWRSRRSRDLKRPNAHMWSRGKEEEVKPQMLSGCGGAVS